MIDLKNILLRDLIYEFFILNKLFWLETEHWYEFVHV